MPRCHIVLKAEGFEFENVLLLNDKLNEWIDIHTTIQYVFMSYIYGVLYWICRRQKHSKIILFNKTQLMAIQIICSIKYFLSIINYRLIVKDNDEW